MLRSKTLDRPPVPLTGVQQTVVESVLAVLPELVALGPQPEAAPVLGQRQLALLDHRRELRHQALQHLAALHRTALRRGEGAQLAAARAGADVLGGLLHARALHRSLDAYLAAERVPVEQQRGSRVVQQLERLSTLVVRVE